MGIAENEINLKFVNSIGWIAVESNLIQSILKSTDGYENSEILAQNYLYY